ncbi:MAG: hypothetical protein ABL986_08375 [Vicinamibacterales bacterium]
MTRIHQLALAVALTLGVALPAWAQLPVTPADIQRLQDSLTQAGTELQQLRSQDASRAGDLQPQLDDLRDEVTYLRVKLRKEGNVPRGDYAEVRDRIDDLRSRASAGARVAVQPAPAPAPAPRPSTSPRANGEIPVGTEIDVRLQTALNSGTATAEDRFEATTLVDLVADARTVIPAGSVMRGVVTAVEPATRTNRTARMTVSFDQVTVNGRAYPMRGTVTQAIEGEGIRGETTRAGAGAGVGAVIGGLLGGIKGAIAGILIGGGGAIAATEGKQVELPPGSVLRVRFDSALQIAGR